MEEELLLPPPPPKKASTPSDEILLPPPPPKKKSGRFTTELPKKPEFVPVPIEEKGVGLGAKVPVAQPTTSYTKVSPPDRVGKMLNIQTMPSEKPAFVDNLRQKAEVTDKILNDPTFTLMSSEAGDMNEAKRVKIFEKKNEAVAADRGYDNVQQLYSDMDESLADFLDDRAKQEYIGGRDRVDLLKQLNKAKADGQPTEDLQKKYDDQVAQFSKAKAELITSANEEVKNLRRDLEGADPDEKADILSQIEALEASKKDFFKPKAEQVKAIVQEAGLTEGATDQEKVRIYAHSLMRERSDLREALGITKGQDAMIAYYSTAGADNPYWKRLQDVEDKLEAVAPVALINETPITGTESAWGVFGKVFKENLVPQATDKGTQQEVSGNLIKGLELSGVDPKNIKEDVYKTLEKTAKPYEDWSSKDLALMVAPTLAIIPKFIATTIITEGLGSFAAVSPYWRSIKILSERGSLGLAATEGSLLRVMQANKYGRGLLQASFKGLEYGTQSQVETMIYGADKGEMGFVNGLVGGFLGAGAEKATKLVGKGVAKIITSIFGNKAPEATGKLLELAGKAYKYTKEENAKALGEVGEELGEDLGGMWMDSENGKEFFGKIEEHYGTTSKALKFFLSTYMMGYGFGAASKLGSAAMSSAGKMYKGLSEKDRAIADNAISDMRQEQNHADVDAGIELVNESDLSDKEKAKAEEQITAQGEAVNGVIEGNLTTEELDNVVSSFEEMKQGEKVVKLQEVKPINQKQNEKDNEVRNVQEGQGNEGNERGQQDGNEDGQNTNVQEANGEKTNGQKEVTNAVQEPGTGEVLQRQPQEAGVPGSERTGVEQGQQGQEVAKESSQKEVAPQTKSSEPSNSDKNYQEAQKINSIVSKENPNASVLIQPKGNDLSLTAIYVGKEKRGEGIGTKVLGSVKAQAKKAGKKVVLDVTNELDQETDLGRLGKFYERNGFKKTGETTYEYDPKNEVSSRDTGARTDNTGTEDGNIASVTDKGESGKKPIAATEEVVPLTEGSTTTLPAASKYGQPREMVYKDGKWQQKIGREFTEVSTTVQKEAEAAFAATPAKVDAGVQTIRDAKESLKTWLAENHVVSSNPNIKQASIVDINKLIDVAFSIAEKVYTASKDIAQALNKAVEHVKASDWYNGLSNSEKRDAVNQVKGNVLEGIVLSNPELVKKTSEVAVSTESQVKPARKTFGWMYFGTKDKVRFLKFSGEATLDNLEQQSPDSYANRAYDIAKYAIAKIDVRKNFFDAMNKFLGTDPNAEKYVISVAKAIVKKSLAGKTVTKSLIAKKDDEASVVSDKKKAKEMLKAVAAAKTAEEVYSLLNNLPDSFRTLGSKLIGDIFQARTFDVSASAVDKIKAKRKANKITASQATEEIAEAIFRKKSIAEKVEEGRAIYNDVKEKFKGNLKFVYDLVSPAIRNLSKLWYDGANLIAQNFGKEYGLNVAQSSGIIASQSPQMPWFSNLHLAQAIMDIMANKKDEVFTKEFLDFYIKGAKKYADQIKYIPSVKALVGKKLGEMSDYDAAIFVRAYYELNMSRKAPVRLPSGVITGYETGDSSFGGYGTIEKGVSIFRNGSDENISEQLGDANKVRNFYNNIADPTNKKAVTIDTHAIAIANMLPLASNDYEVKFDPATYSLYSDAYNELAEELGLGARELQSITWEAARALFPAEKKSESGYKKKISDIWDAYNKGEITIEQARENIKQNGYNPNFTEWSEHLQDWLEGKSGADYIRAINPKGFTPGSTTSGTGQGVNGGVSGVAGGNKSKGGPAVSTGVEKIKPTKNEKTKGLQYSETEGGIPMLSESGGSDYAGSGEVQREESASKTVFNSIVGVWNKFKNIQFSGTTKVKDASDVAHIMQLLENKSVEQSFAVHVDKSGKSHVQFLSIGGLTGTVIDAKAVLAGAKKFKAVSTYLVHNHPSGKLVPSQADLNITENIRKGFAPLGIKLEHIIMDTYSKEYVHIDEQGLYSVEKRDLSKTDNVKLTTYVLDEQKIIEAPVSKVGNQNDAANFIQQLRFTAMPKNAVMLLSNDNKIIGNYVFQGEVIDYDQLTSFIAGSGVGNSVIFYGNQNNVDQVKGIKELLKSLDVNVLDYIVVDSDSSSVQQYYNSIDLNSRLGETQSKYGTDSVAKSQTEQVRSEELPVEGFKASEEAKKAAEIAIKMETAMAKAPSLKEKQTAKLSEEIEALKLENPEKAEVIDTIVNNIDAIRAQLLEAGIIESINCKWG